MRNQKSLFAIFCIVTILLAGCGSSSKPTSTTTTTTTTVNTNGVFADAPVVGLTYTCGTQNAVTGAGGAFTCPAGSNVTFSVGGITLCTAPVQAFMTPVSCAQTKDPTANAATPTVVAVTRFLMSISTTPASSGTMTITSAELQAAANLTLDFSTATDTQLLTAVDAVSPGAALVDPTTAENEIANTVNTAFAGNYAGTYSGGDTGTWTLTIASDGSVTGTATNSKSQVVNVLGSFVSGTIYSGTAGGSATWTGTLDTSKAPAVFSGTWNNPNATPNPVSGTFTGTKQ
jgi:hypothetical protein